MYNHRTSIHYVIIIITILNARTIINNVLVCALHSRVYKLYYMCILGYDKNYIKNIKICIYDNIIITIFKQRY